MGARIGLDFGTSNSTVTVMENGAPRLVPLEGENLTLPSALFFDFELGTDHFGREAIELYTDGHTGRLMRSLKSVLGTGLMAESTRIRSRLVPFDEILGNTKCLRWQKDPNIAGSENLAICGWEPRVQISRK